MIENPNVGMRVMTPDGLGTIDNKELLTVNVNKEMWNVSKPTDKTTGRWGVKLDVNTRSFPISYYWLKELEKDVG